MKKWTVFDLANILQLDNEVKEDLRLNFNNFDDDLKYEIQTVLWDGLFELKKRLAKVKYEHLMLDVDEGKRELTTDLYNQAEKSVWQDFEDILAGKNEDKKILEAIRVQLKPLIGTPPTG